MLKICSAIIPAAGNSTRMALGGRSKQFLDLLGMPALVHTLHAFEQAHRIHEIIVVGREEDIPHMESCIRAQGLQKVKAVVPGGVTRQESVAAGIAKVSPEAVYLAIHDGARPLISPALIDFVVEDAETYRASALGVPVKDTIKVVDGQGFVVDTPKRDTLWAVQTPQVFERALYQEAMDAARKQQADYTDDCQLIERFGVPVHLCLGNYHNLKLTTPEDIVLAEAILQGLQKKREENP
ncbi:MAG: 2-C-methyl-D-erythritol 4-phosphate cytidylyltransferase [Clostridiales bacterium]|jgi:2-C-methyl-D-erythritol 4-phosphate cytidylyltransferase|nr:2-C-methyl-D-erythritol 4-phosphate cytidylyltransferase [Clostridiales bacterium]